MRMGQWPYLLILPGFDTTLSFPDRGDFLPSDHFGKCLALEGAFLQDRQRVEIKEDRVVGISRDGEHYLIRTQHGRYLASYVDVCTGGGPPRRLGDKIVADPELRSAYNNVTRGEAPRLVTGEFFLSKAFGTRVPGHVCVYGGGGTAAWCVEAALAAGSRVVWTAHENPVANAFPPSGRNDDLKARTDFEFLEGHLLLGVERTTTGVALTLHNGAERVRVRADILVAAIGQSSDADTDGSTVRVLSEVFHPDGSERFELRSAPPESRFLGFRDAAGLRLLGAAAMNHPAFDIRRLRADDGYDQYMRHLCAQAKAAPSIPMSAFDIAEANGYFDFRGAVNLNTAPLPWMERCCGDARLAELLCVDRGMEKSPYLERPKRAYGAPFELYYGERARRPVDRQGGPAKPAGSGPV
ncbi:MAG: hypothetical protein R2729_27210 [Bryobacteraceae bacterium]